MRLRVDDGLHGIVSGKELGGAVVVGRVGRIDLDATLVGVETLSRVSLGGQDVADLLVEAARMGESLEPGPKCLQGISGLAHHVQALAGRGKDFRNHVRCGHGGLQGLVGVFIILFMR